MEKSELYFLNQINKKMDTIIDLLESTAVSSKNNSVSADIDKLEGELYRSLISKRSAKTL